MPPRGVESQKPIRSYPVKENPIGFAVTERDPYKHTNILLLYYKINFNFMNF